MASLNLQSFSQIVQSSAATIQSSASSLLDFTTGSVVRAIVESVAGVTLWLQSLIFTTLQVTRLATSTGSACDSFGDDFGFARLPAVAATGNVTFSRYSSTQAALIVPYFNADGSINTNGAQIKASDGSQIFGVTTNTTNGLWNTSLSGYQIPANTASGTVPVQDLVAGSAGNVVANAVTLIASAIPYVDTVTNAAAFTNGADGETDAAFRARFQNFINTRSLATPLAVGYAITSIQSDLTYTIIENYNSASVYQPGYMTITVDDGSGDPSSGLLSTVSRAVNSVRPATVMFGVFGPSLVSAAVVLTITAATGYSKPNLLAPISAAISAYIGTLSVGAPLPYSVISYLAYNAVPGAVANVTGITLNGGTSDLGGGTTQVVRVGSITIN